MSRRKEIALVAAGILAGIAVSGPATQAAAGLMANPSSQKFYINEQRIPLEAYEINGSNYVKLRDIGQTVDFGVTYDAKTNTVTIHPDKPYETEVTAPAPTTPPSQTSPSALSKNTDGSINIPQDGSQYIPQAGDVVRCDDGTNYTITDVSRYDKNYFADGPAGSGLRLEPVRPAGAAESGGPEVQRSRWRLHLHPQPLRNPPDALQPLQRHGRG